MTKEEFSNRYPDGLNNTIVLYQKALHSILMSDEIDRVIKYTKGKEKRQLKRLKTLYREVANEGSWDKWSIWVSIGYIKSPSLFADIITCMTLDNKDVYHGENEN